MKTGVEVTNGKTHRTYRKSAIAPTMLLQANYRHTGEQLVASPAPQARCAGVCYVFFALSFFPLK
jgi:hypothetical protein